MSIELVPSPTTLRRRMNIAPPAQSPTLSETMGGNTKVYPDEPNGLKLVHGESSLDALNEHAGAIAIGDQDVNLPSPTSDYFEDSESVSSESSSNMHQHPSGSSLNHDADHGQSPSRTPRRDAQEEMLRHRVHAHTASPPLIASRTPGTPSSASSGAGDPATARAWYEIDFAVIIALLSPLGNWLTGGDYVKQFLLLALLVFYLHQIIEMPWTLYHNSRPRRRSSSLEEPHSASERVAVAHAESQLQKMELFFLSLAVVSPLLGCLLLKQVLGPDIVSWFNTTLFVLSTGVRPWRHLIARLFKRVNTLHDIIHFPDEGLKAKSIREETIEKENSQTRKELQDLLTRFADMERVLEKMKKRHRDDQETMYEYLDEAVDDVDRNVKKWMEKADEKYAAKGKGSQISPIQTQPPSFGSLVKHYLPSCFKFFKRMQQKYGYTFGIAMTPSSMSPTLSSPNLKYRSTNARGSSSSFRLETIPEEKMASKKSSSSKHGHGGAGRGKKQVKSPWSWIPGFSFIVRVGHVLSLPLRTVVGLIPSGYRK